MELKKYKLGEIGIIVTGKTPSTKDIENFDGNIPFITPEDIAKGFIIKETKRYISEKGYNNIKNNTLSNFSILVGCIGSDMGNVAISEKKCATNQQINAITNIRESFCPLYIYYVLSTHKKNFRRLADSTTTPILPKSVFEDIEIFLPTFSIQRKIASVLSSLDNKIALNRRINAKLEQIAKRLYDYWFVQFDFPNEEGNPYKSSGGKMVWNEVLKREVPEGWEVKRLSDFICKNNTGDWGADEPTDKTIEVGCIRGADIIALNDLPKRFIKSTNTEKLLSEWDMVIEVSGGSPVQATGRCALITPGVIKRNGNKITCSNFCHAFSFKDYRFSAYFYYLWKMFYDNGIMFNYEGKTSGIKNFMTETFLANKWVSAPESLAEKFFGIVKETYAKIDTNIAENNKLIALRDRLLPLLMNGQVEVE